MTKIIISLVALFMLASCASQNLEENGVADAQTEQKQEKSKKRYRSCDRKTMGSRVKRC